ncbi:hypothetical protein CKAN_02189200 [Cinnamomum micranthum f. kanehirae]|uniref:Uncharacterized protein n=1 Tax=Cinnamomum micranthum f. kanehirae TaxID=337451 RepID=A0A443PPG3_9MAGN|nr:hypothetical protein CKAN_02189200 [Cinnamomum micranthum f. kanehirae]
MGLTHSGTPAAEAKSGPNLHLGLPHSAFSAANILPLDLTVSHSLVFSLSLSLSLSISLSRFLQQMGLLKWS